MEDNYISIGKININIFKDISQNILTDEVNLNIILKLAIIEDEVHKKNSIMTMYRIRDKNIKRLIEKNKAIYKNE